VLFQIGGHAQAFDPIVNSLPQVWGCACAYLIHLVIYQRRKNNAFCKNTRDSQVAANHTVKINWQRVMTTIRLSREEYRNSLFMLVILHAQSLGFES
jgi:hypothetical protein